MKMKTLSSSLLSLGLFVQGGWFSPTLGEPQEAKNLKIGFVRMDMVVDASRAVKEAKEVATKQGDASLDGSPAVLKARVETYDRLVEMIAKLAKAEGFTAVFKADSFERGDKNAEVLNYEIGVRSVLYFSEAVDLSARCLAALDGGEKVVAAAAPAVSSGVASPPAGGASQSPAGPRDAAALSSHPQAVKLAREESATGNVEGKVTHERHGLKGVQVKAIRIVRSQNMLGMVKETMAGAEFVTQTNADGVYRFEKIPVGPYGIKWLLPGGRSWVRRMSDKPDVIVKEGETVTAEEIHAGRRVYGE